MHSHSHSRTEVDGTRCSIDYLVVYARRGVIHNNHHIGDRFYVIGYVFDNTYVYVYKQQYAAHLCVNVKIMKKI